MLETELREAMGAFTAPVTAPADLLQGVRVKRHRRIVRNRFLAGGAVAAAVLAAIPFAMSQDTATKRVRPATTSSVTPTSEPSAVKIHATAAGLRPAGPAESLMTQNDVSLDDESVVNQEGALDEHAPIDPGRYTLMIRCEGAGKVRITMETQGRRATKTMDCPSDLRMELSVPKNSELIYSATHLGKGRAAIGWKLYRNK